MHSTCKIVELTLQSPSFHYYGKEESEACIEWISTTLQPELDPELKHLFPEGYQDIPASQLDKLLFHACKDGWLLSKLVNAAIPNTIDTSGLKPHPRTKIHAIANLLVFLDGARALGINLHNVGPDDIWEGTPHIILGLIWQIIKVGLFAKIRPDSSNPKYAVFLSADDLAAASSLSIRKQKGKSKLLNQEQLLLRWVNYHLKQAGEPAIDGFLTGLRQSSVYMHLLRQLSLEAQRSAEIEPLFEEFIQFKTSPERKARLILDAAALFNANYLLTEEDIIKGDKERGVTFLALLFGNVLASTVTGDAPKPDTVNENSSEKLPSSDPAQRIAELEHENAMLKQRLKDEERNSFRLASENRSLQQQNMQLQDRYTELSRTVTEQRMLRKNSGLFRSMSDTNLVVGELRGSQESLNEQLDMRVKNSKIAQLSSEVSRLKTELEFAQSDNERTAARSEQLLRENNSSRLRVDKLIAELTDVKEELENIRTERDLLSSQLKEVQGETSKTSEKMKENEDEISELSQQVAELVQDCSAYKDQLDMLSRERKTLEGIIIDAQQALEQAQALEAVDETMSATRIRALADSTNVIPIEVHRLSEAVQAFAKNYSAMKTKLEEEIYRRNLVETHASRLRGHDIPELEAKLKAEEKERLHLSSVVVPSLQQQVQRLSADLQSTEKELLQCKAHLEGLHGEKEQWLQSERRMEEARQVEVGALKEHIGRLEIQIQTMSLDLENWRQAAEVIRVQGPGTIHMETRLSSKSIVDGLPQDLMVGQKADDIAAHIKELKKQVHVRQVPADTKMKPENAEWLKGDGDKFYALKRRIEESNATLRRHL
jgi:predicted nuclease with TOPRIM domain